MITEGINVNIFIVESHLCTFSTLLSYRNPSAFFESTLVFQ